MASVVHWFRRDLRLEDNVALQAAAARGAVVPVYVFDEDRPWQPGGASRWWLDKSLHSLAHDLSAAGSRLILVRGRPADVLPRLARDLEADAVTLTRLYEPHERGEEAAVNRALAAVGVDCRRFGGSLLFEPEAIRTGTGTPFKVFTPFAKACFSAPAPARPQPAPGRLAAPPVWPNAEAIESLGLHPRNPDWSTGLGEQWRPGEAGAKALLDRFLSEAVADYADHRDRPDLAATSRLSPHLHFGEISPRRCWHAARALAEADGRRARGLEKFLSELLWREFAHHLLFHFPSLPEQPLRPEFAAFPWRDDPSSLRAWQRGRTGYPIVDAGMRELWMTGWMHNRVRMIVASFLVKDLLVPWQQGAAWFWDTLVDADLANNAASWQWVAGCGADAAPYFRIFNPVTQGQKFDPDGAYVRRYVPELARLPTAHLHAPWLAPAGALAEAGIRLGRDYPVPIIDHAKARSRALAAYEQIRAAG
jgi:deoxyribodipyrimidine photo-lyase